MSEKKKWISFEPYGNNLLVQLDEAEEMSSGGIYLPGQARETPTVGVVLAVGPGLKTGFDGTTIPCTSKVGDRVVIMKFAVHKIKMADGRVLTLIGEGDVYGRVTLEEDEALTED